MSVANVFSHFVGSPLTFLIVISEAQKFLILIKSSLFIFVALQAFDVLSKNSLSNPTSWRFTLVFSSKNLKDIWSLTYFTWILSTTSSKTCYTRRLPHLGWRQLHCFSCLALKYSESFIFPFILTPTDKSSGLYLQNIPQIWSFHTDHRSLCLQSVFSVVAREFYRKKCKPDHFTPLLKIL